MVRDPAGAWWQTAGERTEAGDVLVTIQHADGRLQRILLLPTADLEQVIAQAAAAYAAGDRRWRPGSKRV